MSGAEGRPRIFVHIGTHKTGTTSFQDWLARHETELHDRFGLGVYRGAFPNCREVGLACASPSRSLPTRGIPQWVDPEWRRHVSQLVATQLARPDDLVLSSEALSFLRSPAEVETLAHLLQGRELSILVVLRNRADFLESWAKHLQRDRYKISRDPSSFAYVEDDSWLADYDSLLDAYRSVFGAERVHIIDYDHAMSSHGSVIPLLMAEIAGAHAPLPDWQSVRKNVGSDVARSRKEARERFTVRLARLVRHPISTSRRVMARRQQDARY
jgi:hypothetical protein